MGRDEGNVRPPSPNGGRGASVSRTRWSRGRSAVFRLASPGRVPVPVLRARGPLEEKIMRLFQLEGFKKKRVYEERPLRVSPRSDRLPVGARSYGSSWRRARGRGMTRWAENTLDVKAMGARAVVGM